MNQVLADACDIALATGMPIRSGPYWLVPDTWIVEGVANGLPALPATWQLQRQDGRSVSVFRKAA